MNFNLFWIFKKIMQYFLITVEYNVIARYELHVLVKNNVFVEFSFSCTLYFSLKCVYRCQKCGFFLAIQNAFYNNTTVKHHKTRSSLNQNSLKSGCFTWSHDLLTLKFTPLNWKPL